MKAERAENIEQASEIVKEKQNLFCLPVAICYSYFRIDNHWSGFDRMLEKFDSVLPPLLGGGQRKKTTIWIGINTKTIRAVAPPTL